jgi:hypothetical protein
MFPLLVIGGLAFAYYAFSSGASTANSIANAQGNAALTSNLNAANAAQTFNANAAATSPPMTSNQATTAYQAWIAGTFGTPGTVPSTAQLQQWMSANPTVQGFYPSAGGPVAWYGEHDVTTGAPIVYDSQGNPYLYGA